MRVRRVLLGATAVAVSALGIAGGCSADPGTRRSALPTTPLVAAPSASASALASVAAPVGGASLDLESFTPWLALPDWKNVADALESGDAARAVRELEAGLAKKPPAPADAPSLQFLLGRLRESAGDFAGAASAFEASARAEWPLSDYAALGAGKNLVKAGRAKDALDWLGRVTANVPAIGEARLLSAEASVLSGDPDRAIETWRASVAENPNGADGAQTSLRLGEALVARAAATDPSDATRPVLGREALALARRVLVHAPDDEDATARAKAVETAALALLPAAERAERAHPTAEEALEQLRALIDAKQFSGARDTADSLLVALGDKGKASAIGCEAEVLRGRAWAGTGEWGKASDLLGDAARRCKDKDLRARALFLAGKYADSDKRYAVAVRNYETLEKELPDNRLADDARLRAALSYAELGAEARFTDLLSRMPDDYPAGDMLLDGMFELAMHRIEKGDWPGATTVLARAADIARPTDAKRGQEFSGRERYFLARAWGATGDRDKALAEYEGVVRDLPFSYYMLHAYSRLTAADPERARKALEGALEASASSPFSIEKRPEFGMPGFVRAFELLRAGDFSDAERELRTAGAENPDAAPGILWAVALLYARSGAAKLSNDVARGLLDDWPSRWPSGDWVRAWQIVFPRPYHDLVQREAKRSAVPEYLVYAVMREESSFDPDAESPANAYGLMQLIEPTARHFGKPLGMLVNQASLKRPAVNVAIGCRVLSELTRTFSENPLLAIPGYNAGAGRPRRWVAERPAVDFDVWVEEIPYTETRRYTKRVLSSRAAYAFLYAPAEGDAALRLPLTVSPSASATANATADASPRNAAAPAK